MAPPLHLIVDGQSPVGLHFSIKTHLVPGEGVSERFTPVRSLVKNAVVLCMYAMVQPPPLHTLQALMLLIPAPSTLPGLEGDRVGGPGQEPGN